MDKVKFRGYPDSELIELIHSLISSGEVNIASETAKSPDAKSITIIITEGEADYHGRIEFKLNHKPGLSTNWEISEPKLIKLSRVEENY